MIDGEEVDRRFSLVEHPMSARALAAPIHKHTREDEYSYVLQGSVGALLGDEVVIGKPGDLIFKPRNQWHTFWNAGDEPAWNPRKLACNKEPVAGPNSGRNRAEQN
jgi:mannose-6-phosphate isomerase-like protein (cupin superfamily)